VVSRAFLGSKEGCMPKLRRVGALAEGVAGIIAEEVAQSFVKARGGWLRSLRFCISVRDHAIVSELLVSICKKPRLVSL
jgi:hypothetical protein